MKSCRSRRELEALEQKLQFKTAKEWNMRLTAHARSGNLQRALGMPREMRSAGVAPGVITYNRLIKACERHWRKALPLLERMRGEGIEPDVFSYNAAIAACEKGKQWKEALSLFRRRRDAGRAARRDHLQCHHLRVRERQAMGEGVVAAR